MLIAIEGIDGSGKGTLARRLAETSPSNRLYSFPDYETAAGREIRAWLTDGRAQQMPLAFQALQTVNRLERVDDVERDVAARFQIRDYTSGVPSPATSVVVLDRYYGSAMAYGAASGLDPEWVRGVHSTLPQPDLWVVLDVPVHVSMERRPERRDGYERDAGFLRAVRAAYLALATGGGLGGTTLLVDATAPADEVLERVRAEVASMGGDVGTPAGDPSFPPVGKWLDVVDSSLGSAA